MTETPRPWDRRSTETTKAYAAFLAYIALGARRSVREALRQNSGETAVSGKLRTREGWSSKNAWVSRANARDEWLARTADEQVVINIKACLLALTETALTLLKTGGQQRLSTGGASTQTALPAGTARGGCLGADRGSVRLVG